MLISYDDKTKLFTIKAQKTIGEIIYRFSLSQTQHFYLFIDRTNKTMQLSFKDKYGRFPAISIAYTKEVVDYIIDTFYDYYNVSIDGASYVFTRKD